MKGTFPVSRFQALETPFYYYDTQLLRRTLAQIVSESRKCEKYIVHYAVKANANPKLLAIIRESGLGADCVSGGEIRAAIHAGMLPKKIVFAGVGKADWEINLGLAHGIFCFNVESVPELEIINKLGLHARASAKLTQLASKYACEVWMTRNNQRINAKSIMGVMMLAAGKGSKVLLETDGEDEVECMQALTQLINNRFGEAE